MIIDIIFLICMVIAIFKGYRNGFIVAVFSLLAIIIGLTAAVKLSAYVANQLGTHTSVSKAWLPFLSFAIVMITVVILVRIGASMIQQLLEVAFLGWANKLAGIALYAVLYLLVLSVVMFYAEKLQFLTPEVVNASRIHGFLQPWGPKVIDGIGMVIPFFKDLFEQLSGFFEAVKPTPTPTH